MTADIRLRRGGLGAPMKASVGRSAKGKAARPDGAAPVGPGFDVRADFEELRLSALRSVASAVLVLAGLTLLYVAVYATTAGVAPLGVFTLLVATWAGTMAASRG